jgi:hypothetical protein
MSPNKHKTVIKKQNNNKQLDGRTETRIQLECYRAFTRQPAQYPDYTEITRDRAAQTFDSSWHKAATLHNSDIRDNATPFNIVILT